MDLHFRTQGRRIQGMGVDKSRRPQGERHTRNKGNRSLNYIMAGGSSFKKERTDGLINTDDKDSRQFVRTYNRAEPTAGDDLPYLVGAADRYGLSAVR